VAKPRPPKLAPVDGLLVVDKPIGPTSHDVVQWARRVLGTSQVGHTGTLDPMASGVLVLGVGQGTKLMPHLGAEDKRYEATLRLGRGTRTLDAEGEVLERVRVPEGLTLERVREVAATFVGTLSQQAPDVSAIKVGGRALHERVRAGETVDAPFRDVVCHALEVHALSRSDDPEGALDVTLALHTGKGYYVRSLGRDLALALGTVGHLVQLRRTRNGAFDVEGALDGALLAGCARRRLQGRHARRRSSAVRGRFVAGCAAGESCRGGRAALRTPPVTRGALARDLVGRGARGARVRAARRSG
jgi:tRNA pseudouridine55 synthase